MQKNIYQLKKDFLEYLEIQKGRSLKTIENYDRYISSFLQFSKINSPTEINPEIIREFHIHLNRQENHKKGLEKGTLKKKTQNYYLIALRAFLKYLSKNDIETLAPEKIELAKTSMRELDLISDDDFKKLIKEPKIQNLENLRAQAILELLYSTGLRVSELCSIDDDLNLDADEFSIRGKGGKVRIVFLTPTAKKWIKKYLELRNKEQNTLKSEALFITKKGNRIDPRTVQRIIKKRATEAGIRKNVTPHTIRHFFATDLLKNGADIRSVQMLLGHSSINTTQIYTNISDKFLKEIHKKFHGKTNEI